LATAVGSQVRLCGFLGILALIIVFFIVLIYRCPDTVYPDINYLLKNGPFGWVVAFALMFPCGFLVWIMNFQRKSANKRIDELSSRLRDYEQEDPKLKGRPSSLIEEQE
jgi:uncharacterized membrane protein YciS (DUF1049 family)